LLAAVTCFYLSAFLLQVPNLNGNWEWFRQYRPLPIAHGLSFVVAVCCAIGGLAWRGRRQSGRYGGWWIVGLGVLAIGLQAAVVSMNSEGWYWFVERVYKPGRTGYFADARRIDTVGEFLRTYVERMPRFTMRTSTHPPGSALFFWAVLRAAEKCPHLCERLRPPKDVPAWLNVAHVPPRILAQCALGAIALLVASASALGPLYLLGRMLYSHRTALTACVFYTVTPVFAIRVPYMDHVYPVITVLSFCAFLRAVERKDCRWAAASGGALSVGVFMSFGLLAMGVFCAAFLLARRPDFNRRGLLRLMGAFVCAFVVPFVLLRVFAGFDVVDSFRQAMENHRRIAGERTYALWVAYNPYEFFSWLGIPVTWLFLRAAFGKRRVDALWTASVVTLIFLNVSGKSLGEVERLWLFMAPYVVLVAAAELARERDASGFWTVFALQCASVCAFNSAISGEA